MFGRRRLGRAYLLGSLLLLAASLHTPTAYSAPGDPPIGSPAGSVYQLPLQQGRADAAPKGGGETGAPGGGGASAGKEGEGGSLYRTENNFGSSSEVPGAAAGAAGGGKGGGNDVTGDGGARGGSKGAEEAAGAPAADLTDSGNTSVPVSLALLGGIILLGAALALLSRRFRVGQAG
jgi:hypothetical protein